MPKPKDKDGGSYVNPDSDGSVAPMFQSLLESSFPSAWQVEVKFMDKKYPVNPKSGLGSPHVNTSSPPKKRPGGLDPTVALFDGESGVGGGFGGGDFGGGNVFIGDGCTDFVRGWGAFNPKPEPVRGEISPNTG
jgi:hypothetical protein